MKYFWMIKIGNIKTVMQELLMMLTYIYQRLFKTFKWKSSTAFLNKEMKHAMHSFIWYIYYHASMYMYMYYDNDNPYWKTSSLLLFELALYSIIVWNESQAARNWSLLNFFYQNPKMSTLNVTSTEFWIISHYKYFCSNYMPFMPF